MKLEMTMESQRKKDGEVWRRKEIRKDGGIKKEITKGGWVKGRCQENIFRCSKKVMLKQDERTLGGKGRILRKKGKQREGVRVHACVLTNMLQDKLGEGREGETHTHLHLTAD